MNLYARGAWRRAHIFPIYEIVVGSYICIFVEWLVLVYRYIARLRSMILLRAHCTWINWKICCYQILHAYYRLGTLDFVEICDILRIEALFTAHFAIISKWLWKRWQRKNIRPFQQSSTYILPFFSLSFPFSMYFTSTIIVKYDKICPNKPRIVLSSMCCLLPVFDSCDCETMDSSLCVNSHFPFSIKCSRFIYDNILHALCARRLFLSRWNTRNMR